jgi:hypothetical protein
MGDLCHIVAGSCGCRASDARNGITAARELDAVRSREHACIRRGGSKQVGGPLDRVLRARLLRLMPEGGVSAPVIAIAKTTGCDVVEAMQTFRHLTYIAGLCHSCAAPIPVADFVDCPKCHGLNITVPPTRIVARDST